MQVQTTLTRDDYFSFVAQVYGMICRPGGSIVYYLLAGTFIGLSFVALDRLVPTLHGGSLVAGLVFGVALFYAIMVWVTKRMAPDIDGLILGPQTVELRDDGITVTATNHNSFYRWTTVHSVEQAPKHLFLMLDRNLGLIIPKRCFSSDDRMTQFTQFAKDRTTKQM